MSFRTLTLTLVLVLGALGVGAPGPRPAQGQGPSAEPGSQVSTEPGAQLRVWLVTASPGDAIWERYGHNAIRILDTETGRDVAYNWGIFDFQQADFVPRFLQGRMLYMMAPFQTRPMLDSYASADREVVLQELDLSPAQKLELSHLADRNALPENRDYLYQYFRDNCSTRVRDLLDLVLGGVLRSRFGTEYRGATYREQTRRLTQLDPLVYTGIDLLLGAHTDLPISVWDEMFLPPTLRDEIREVTITGPDGIARPLVTSEEVVVASSRPVDPEEPPRWFVTYLLLGLLLGAVLASSPIVAVRSRKALRVAVSTASVLWSVSGGVIGTVLVLLLFTDHSFAHWNENLFLFNPLMLPLAVMIPMARLGGRWRSWARAVALTVAGIAVLGFAWQIVPASTHENAIFFALALPSHLGLAYAITRTSPRTPGRPPAADPRSPTPTAH